MLDWIDFGPELWLLTALIHTLVIVAGVIVVLGTPTYLLLRLIQRLLVFRRSALHITAADIDEQGVYIGPLLKLQSDSGLIVEGQLGRVTINNNVWVDWRFVKALPYLSLVPCSTMHLKQSARIVYWQLLFSLVIRGLIKSCTPEPGRNVVVSKAQGP